MAVSPDKKILYVGGQFTQVNGSNRYRLVAFDLTKSPATVLTSFTATTDASVYGLTATETRLYAAGIFSKVNNAARTGAAAVDARTGAVLPFQVTPAGGTIRQVAVSPDRTKIVLGGTFKSLNGSSNPGYGMAMVNAETGARLSLPINSMIRNAGSTAAITSLVAGTDGFYGTGQAYGRTEGNFEGAFKADWNGNRIWIEDCHGDTYGAAIDGTVIYIAGHPHDCARIGGFPNTVNPSDLQPCAGLHHGDDPHPDPEHRRRLLQLRGSARAVTAALVPAVHRGHLHRTEPGHLECRCRRGTMSPTPGSSSTSTGRRSRAWSDSRGLR